MANSQHKCTNRNIFLQVNEVLNHLAVVKYIGIGVGMGGNILLRHALKYPERVDSLMLVSTSIDAPGWIEWGYQKRNISHMRTHGVTQVSHLRGNTECN